MARSKRKTTSKKKPQVVKLGGKKIVIKHPWATRAACKRMGYSSGCDPRCLNKLEKRWGVRTARARLAKALCKINKKKRK